MNGIIEQDAPRLKERLVSMVLSDEELLLEYRDHGNRPAFEELVHRYEKELYGYLRNYLGDPEMAEDVFQQTFLQIYLKCDQFEPERKLRPWLYAVATNQAIDHQRRYGRHRMASLDRRMGKKTRSPIRALLSSFSTALTGDRSKRPRTTSRPTKFAAPWTTYRSRRGKWSFWYTFRV